MSNCKEKDFCSSILETLNAGIRETRGAQAEVIKLGDDPVM